MYDTLAKWRENTNARKRVATQKKNFFVKAYLDGAINSVPLIGALAFVVRGLGLVTRGYAFSVIFAKPLLHLKSFKIRPSSMIIEVSIVIRQILEWRFIFQKQSTVL